MSWNSARSVSTNSADILRADEVADTITDMRREVIADLMAEYVPPESYVDSWDAEGLKTPLFAI